MDKSKTRASFWENPVKIDACSIRQLGVNNPVLAIVYGEDGTIGIYYPGIENEEKAVKAICTDDVWKRIEYLSSWKTQYQAFKIPPKASDNTSFFVAACNLLEGHDVPLGPLKFPPDWP